MENLFQIGDVVWAKIRGYAWWPAMVDLYFDIRLLV